MPEISWLWNWDHPKLDDLVAMPNIHKGQGVYSTRV